MTYAQQFARAVWPEPSEPWAGSYLGQDGLLHCQVCRKPVQTRIVVCHEPRVVRCTCDCDRKKENQWLWKQWQIQRRQGQLRCFGDSRAAAWNFSRDDRRNPRLTRALEQYIRNFGRAGNLLLWGGLGRGKSFYAACVTNALLDQGHPCRFLYSDQVPERFSGVNGQKALQELNRCRFLVVEDVGDENGRVSPGVEQLLDLRCRTPRPLLLTTHLPPEQLQSLRSTNRLWHRVLQNCRVLGVESGQ